MNQKVQFIYDNLKEVISNPTTELNFTTNFELLVSVILSAQCTDKRVNEVTKTLFKVANTPEQFSVMSQEKLEELIHPCGFYRNKARNIINCSKVIVEKYNGQVPHTYDELLDLSGVGSKTANVMLAVGFDKPGLAVDTHVQRVSSRLGLTDSTNALKTEKQLKGLFDEDKWSEVHHLILLFGRYFCTSRNPKCADCRFKRICKYYKVKGER